MKGTLTELNNTFQGTNNTVEKANDQSRYFEDDKATKHPTRIAKRKKEF